MPVCSVFTASVSRCAFVTRSRDACRARARREKLLRARQEANVLAVLVLQRLHVEAEIAAPVIEAVPLERADLRLEARRERRPARPARSAVQLARSAAARPRARRNCRSRDRAACRPCRRARCRLPSQSTTDVGCRRHVTMIQDGVMTDFARTTRRLLDAACAIARDAGRAILEVYGRADFVVERKSDDSPLTEADQVAHRIISRALAKLDASYRSCRRNRAADHATRRAWTRYWLVDPLDGTKEFLKRNGEFTVNIALVDEHRAVLGVVYAPVLDRMYSGAVGIGAWRSDEAARRSRSPCARERRVAVARRRQSQPSDTRARGLPRRACLRTRSPTWAARSRSASSPRAPRTSIRGSGPTSEWDTAAAQAILESAGGRMIDEAGRPLRYNSKDDLLNPHFLAFGDQQRDWLAPIQNTRGRQSRH